VSIELTSSLLMSPWLTLLVLTLGQRWAYGTVTITPSGCGPYWLD
jgi:hypothetical protein